MKKPDVNPSDIYTITETCKALGVDRRTLHRWTSAGRIISHIRIADNRIVYRGEDIASCYSSII